MSKKQPKNKGGRPRAITPEKEQMLINLMSDGMSQNKACKYVGINKSTILDHKKRFPSFIRRLERAKLETTRFAFKSIKKGMLVDWKAGAWWLERIFPKRFRERKEIEVSNKPILIDDIMGEESDK